MPNIFTIYQNTASGDKVRKGGHHRGQRRVATDKNSHDQVRRNLGKGGKGDCLNVKYELEMTNDFDSQLEISQDVIIDTDPVSISSRTFDPAIDKTNDEGGLDKIKSCDERCLDKDVVDGYELSFCTTDGTNPANDLAMIKVEVEGVKLRYNAEKDEAENALDPCIDASCDCCRISWSGDGTTTLSAQGFRCGKGRKLGTIDDVLSVEEVKHIFNKYKDHTNLEGKYAARRDHLLSEDACSRVKAYAEKSFLKEDFDESIIDVAVRNNLPRHAHYHIDLTGVELMNLIGRDDVQTLVNFFHEATGSDETPVTKIRLQRSDNKDVLHHITFHVDKEDNLVVLLGGNEDFTGGAIGYLNHDDGVVHDTGDVIPGTGIFQKSNTLHSVMAWTGVRYTLMLMSDEGAAPDDDILRDILADGSD